MQAGMRGGRAAARSTVSRERWRAAAVLPAPPLQASAGLPPYHHGANLAPHDNNALGDACGKQRARGAGWSLDATCCPGSCSSGHSAVSAV